MNRHGIQHFLQTNTFTWGLEARRHSTEMNGNSLKLHNASGTSQNVYYYYHDYHDYELYRTKTRNKQKHVHNPYFNYGRATSLWFAYKPAIRAIHTLTITKQNFIHIWIIVNEQAWHATTAPNHYVYRWQCNTLTDFWITQFTNCA